MTTISIDCPHCGKHNDITASQVPEPVEISCSHCLAPIGKWSELEKRTKGLGTALQKIGMSKN
jgi:hypothetical protein